MLEVVKIEDLQKVRDDLFKFVWDFKHGDNIQYNFQVLAALYKTKNDSHAPNILNKPITISIVSIIEAVLIDFLTRINEATNHLPNNISQDSLDKMKQEIEKQKKPFKVDSEIGERIYLRRKMYNFSDIVKVFRKYEIFGATNDPIYDQLLKFGDLRNRVHIENYHGNFEDRENKVFTSQRLTELEEIMDALWSKMTAEFQRPWSEA